MVYRALWDLKHGQQRVNIVMGFKARAVPLPFDPGADLPCEC